MGRSEMRPPGAKTEPLTTTVSAQLDGDELASLCRLVAHFKAQGWVGVSRSAIVRHALKSLAALELSDCQGDE